MNEMETIREVRRISLISMLVNILLAGVKMLVGFLGHSQAVIADGVHSLSDLATDIAVLFGVKFWTAPPDQNHPYGHRRVEALITVVIGLILVGVAIGIGYNSITTIHVNPLKTTGRIALIGPILSIIFKEILYRWNIDVGKRIRSTAVIANAWHHRSDAISSLPAMIAVIAASINPEWAFVDHIGALVVSLFILKVAWGIVGPSLAELTDAGAGEKERLLIESMCCQVGGVKEVHAIRTRKLGSGIHVDLHILVNPEIPVRQGHQISEDVKSRLLSQGPQILDVVVHLEPFEGAEAG